MSNSRPLEHRNRPRMLENKLVGWNLTCCLRFDTSYSHASYHVHSNLPFPSPIATMDINHPLTSRPTPSKNHNHIHNPFLIWIFGFRTGAGLLSAQISSMSSKSFKTGKSPMSTRSGRMKEPCLGLQVK